MTTIRAGDTVIVCIGHATNEQAAAMQAQLKRWLPDVADVIVVAATQIAVYRPAIDQ